MLFPYKPDRDVYAANMQRTLFTHSERRSALAALLVAYLLSAYNALQSHVLAIYYPGSIYIINSSDGLAVFSLTEVRQQLQMVLHLNHFVHPLAHSRVVTFFFFLNHICR